ncbi:MAG: acyl-CoA thioesterase [Chitinophagales bacterium]|nr:acyl-CoA thioesterase [Chitinophagales bacterium]
MEKELPKILESTATVRFQDCDPNRHLNNARFIHYFINAREDQVKEYYDFDLFKLAAEEGIGWFITQSQIAFFRPAMLMEEVVIQSKTIGFTDRKLKVELLMFNRDKSSLKSVMWAEFTHYNFVKQKSETHDQRLIDMFSAVVVPLETNIFEERVQQLRNLRH